MKSWMIYGAYGYTGQLIAAEAKRRDLNPILAGRNPQATQQLAERLSLSARAFACHSAQEIIPHLQDIDLVLHCAGPFSETSEAMREACLAARVHYLDITGEISVLEETLALKARFGEAGVVGISGVGFDVVPTDCLAALLKEKMPEATHLSLAFSVQGRLSPGTTKTMIENLPQQGAIRRNGIIESVPTAFEVRRIRFNSTARSAVTIPWGDVATAYHSTGIPNIRVYLASSEAAIQMMKLATVINPLVKIPLVRNALKKIAGKMVKGPSEHERTVLRSMLWGEVRNAQGEILEMRLRTPEPYALTVETALAAVERVRAGKVPAGSWTPSQAFGSQFILSFQGVETI